MSDSGDEVQNYPDDEQGDSDPEYEDTEQEVDEPEGDDEDSGSDYAAETTTVSRRGTRTRKPKVAPSAQKDFYVYPTGMTDRQRRQQDERNFAEATKKEKKFQRVADSKRKIRFDSKGNLEHKDDSANKKGTKTAEKKDSKWQSAVFHHWIRDELAEAANRRGAYIFPRLSGFERTNSTSFVETQRIWGKDRPHYAPIMFEYEPINRTSPTARPWIHNGRLVIDYWLRPLQQLPEIPAVLSSEYEGEFMEPAERANSNIGHTDFRQRMPPFIFQNGSLRPVWNTNNLAKKMRMFRYRAGAITWMARDKTSDKIKASIDRIHAQQRPGRIGNDTHGCQDLTRDQISGLFGLNPGTRSKPPKSGGREKGRRKRKRSVLSSDRGEAEDVGISRTRGLPSIARTLEDPVVLQDNDTSNSDIAVSPEESKAKSETEEDTDDADQEADVEDKSDMSVDSSEDINDFLYEDPNTPEEHAFIQRLLQPTLAHYYDITGFNIQEWDQSGAYIDQIKEIENAMHDYLRMRGHRGDGFPTLLQLEDFNEARAVWNLRWHAPTFGGDPPDLSEQVGQQLDGSGRRWQGGRWV